jgi:hypothetical protein
MSGMPARTTASASTAAVIASPRTAPRAGPPWSLRNDARATNLSDSSLAALLDRVASSDPAPGAGPSVGWTCAFAAALVEMVSAVALRKGPPDPAAAVQRRDRAAELRARALELADRDVAAYTEVLAVLRRRDEPGHGRRLRAALSEAGSPRDACEPDAHLRSWAESPRREPACELPMTKRRVPAG